MKISSEFDATISPYGRLAVPLNEADGCRWPLEDKKGRTLFCNSATDTVLASYCTYHRRLVYTPARRK